MKIKWQVSIENKQRIKNRTESSQLFHFGGGKIEFQNVSFGFPVVNNPPTNLVLNEFNATFEAGSVNAIVGQSGQGKSTLFNLIYKLYDPFKGKILVDGQDIKQLDNDSYRKVN